MMILDKKKTVVATMAMKQKKLSSEMMVGWKKGMNERNELLSRFESRRIGSSPVESNRIEFSLPVEFW